MAGKPIETLISSNLYVLHDNAAVVFLGTLIGKRLVERPGRLLTYTEYTFDVDDYLKGDPTASSITIVNAGGQSLDEGFTMSTAHSYNLQLNQQYMVFLRHGYESLVLPIITVMSIHDDGEVIASADGRPLVALDPTGEMHFADLPRFDSLRYGQATGIGSSPPVPEPTEPTPTSSGAQVHPRSHSSSLAPQHAGNVAVATIKALLSQ